MFANQELGGKVALVTGGTRGIGRAIALELARRGAKVAVNYVQSEAEAGSVVGEIAASGGHGFKVKADVSLPAECDSLLQEIRRQWGEVEVLVNNAGIARETPLEQIELDQWLRTLAVNLTSVYLLTQAVLPAMRSRRFGRIVNVGSIAGLTGGVVAADYAASKAALIGFTKKVARELAGSGVSVNLVAPGFIATDMSAAVLQKYPNRSVGKPEDVAEVVAMLCSLHSAYLSGAVIEIGGGA